MRSSINLSDIKDSPVLGKRIIVPRHSEEWESFKVQIKKQWKEENNDIPAETKSDATSDKQ